VLEVLSILPEEPNPFSKVPVSSLALIFECGYADCDVYYRLTGIPASGFGGYHFSQF